MLASLDGERKDTELSHMQNYPSLPYSSTAVMCKLEWEIPTTSYWYIVFIPLGMVTNLGNITVCLSLILQLWNSDHGKESTIKAFHESLKK